MDHPGVTFKLNAAISNFPGLFRGNWLTQRPPRGWTGDPVEFWFGFNFPRSTLSIPVLRSQTKACSHREWAARQHLISPVGCSDCVKISCPSLRLTPYEFSSNATKAIFPTQHLQQRRMYPAFFCLCCHHFIISQF